VEDTGNGKLSDKKAYLAIGQALELLVLLVLAMFIWSFLVGSLINFIGIEGNNNFSYTVLNLVLPILAYGTIFIYAFKVKNLSIKYFTADRDIKLGTYLKVFFLFLGYLFLLSILNYIVQLLLPVSEDTLKIFEKFLGGNLFAVLLSVCVIAPVAEEAIFRGLILKDFIKHMNKWVAILLSALFFGVLHLNIWQGISAFFLGILLGWLYVESGSLKLSIFAHAANNFIAVSLGRLGSNLEVPETVEVSVSISDYLVVGVLGLIIFSLSLCSLKRELYLNRDINPDYIGEDTEGKIDKEQDSGNPPEDNQDNDNLKKE
jgi:hypothetical protein